MLLATVSKPKQLLHLTFIGQVSLQDLEQGRNEIATLLDELTTGFRLLADFSPMDSIDIKASEEIGKTMELCDQRGVALIVRIIPDPGKDIGMNILSVFHYHRRPRIVTCERLAEAAEILGLGRHEDPNDVK